VCVLCCGSISSSSISSNSSSSSDVCASVLFRISPAQSPNTSGAYESARAAGDVTAAVGIAPVAFPPTAHPPRRPTPVLHWTRLLVLHSLPFAHDPTTTPVRLQTTHTTLPCCRYLQWLYFLSLSHTHTHARAPGRIASFSVVFRHQTAHIPSYVFFEIKIFYPSRPTDTSDATPRFVEHDTRNRGSEQPASYRVRGKTERSWAASIPAGRPEHFIGNAVIAVSVGSARVTTE